MIVTKFYHSKYDESEIVVVDSRISTRNNQVAEVIEVKYIDDRIPFFVYTIKFNDGFIMERVDQYDLRRPTIEELERFSKERQK